MLINIDMHTPTHTYTLMLVNGCLCLQGFLEWKAAVGTCEWQWDPMAVKSGKSFGLPFGAGMKELIGGSWNFHLGH